MQNCYLKKQQQTLKKNYIITSVLNTAAPAALCQKGCQDPLKVGHRHSKWWQFWSLPMARDPKWSRIPQPEPQYGFQGLCNKWDPGKLQGLCSACLSWKSLKTFYQTGASDMLLGLSLKDNVSKVDLRINHS